MRQDFVSIGRRLASARAPWSILLVVAHEIRDKSTRRPRIWRIVEAERASGDKSTRPVQICHVLKPNYAGERGLAGLAAAQRGMVHRRQFEALGIGRGSIAHRVASGSLHPVLTSVFAVGHPSLEPLALEIAGLLYAGDDCLLSHGSAAAMWELIPAAPAGLVQVTLAGRNMRQRSAVRVHRVRQLQSRDVRFKDGIPLTAPARTVLDLAGLTADDVVARAVAEGRMRHLFTDADLDDVLARCPTRAGAARLRRVMRAEAEPLLMRSEAERRIVALIAAAGLPRPETNVRLHGYEVDLLWRAARLVVEVDGHAFHGHRAAFERDRRRDQALAAAGYRVIRVTWRQLEREPLAVMARIAQALATAPAA